MASNTQSQPPSDQAEHAPESQLTSSNGHMETTKTTITSQPGEKLPDTVAGRIAKSLELKEEGNALFKQQEWKKAVKKYHHSLMYAKGITDRPDKLMGFDVPTRFSKPTEDQEKMAEDVSVSVHNNIAACLVKTCDWEKVINHTSKVLELRPGNVKALFRQGTACLCLGQLEEAGELLRKAEMIDPKDVSIKRQLQLLQRKEEEYVKSEQKMYQAMFS